MKNPIYIKLMNEDVDVWRPAIATEQSDSTFLIEPQLTPDCEVWQFKPGQVVLCQRRHLSGGWNLVATRRIDNVEL